MTMDMNTRLQKKIRERVEEWTAVNNPILHRLLVVSEGEDERRFLVCGFWAQFDAFFQQDLQTYLLDGEDYQTSLEFARQIVRDQRL